MTIADFIRQNIATLKAIEANHIQPQDVAMIGMYAEAQQLIGDGKKVGWVAADLSAKYNISVRQFYYVLNRMKKEIL